MGNIIIIAIVAVPALFFLVLRSNAALTFLSLCLGSVLAQVVASDTSQVLSTAAKMPASSTQTISLVLLLAPAVLTALFMLKSVKPNHLPLQFIPALGVGPAALLIAQPYLPTATRLTLQQAPYWSKLTGLEVIIVGVTAFICLLIVWSQRPKKPKLDEHHK